MFEAHGAQLRHLRPDGLRVRPRSDAPLWWPPPIRTSPCSSVEQEGSSAPSSVQPEVRPDPDRRSLDPRQPQRRRRQPPISAGGQRAGRRPLHRIVARHRQQLAIETSW